MLEKYTGKATHWMGVREMRYYDVENIYADY